MINSLTGIVQEIEQSSITFLVQGIGFSISLANPSLLQKEQIITLLIYQHWNAETGPSLFGFSNTLEKQVFCLIIGCSGIGPKIALAILAQLGPLAFLKAIQSGQDKVLSNVNGIGAKKAEQIIVALKHKVAKLIESGINLEDADLNNRQEVMDALKSLNYSRQEIAAAINYLNQEYPQTMVFDQLMRHALNFLAKRI